MIWSGKRRFVQYVGDDTLLSYVEPGFFIYLDGRDASLTPCIVRDGEWERHIRNFISRELKPGGTFIDIGANFGYHALVAAKRVGAAGLVVAFEPQAHLCGLLERSVCANVYMDRFRLQRLAIGAREELASLGKFANLAGSASFLAEYMVAEREEVPMAPLSAALSSLGAEIGRTIVPDLIKIDVEGLEFDVWDGMKDWTRSLDRLTIVLEYSPAGYRGAGRDPLELLRQFREYGFALSRFRALGVTSVTDEDCVAMAASDRQVDLILRK